MELQATQFREQIQYQTNIHEAARLVLQHEIFATESKLTKAESERDSCPLLQQHRKQSSEAGRQEDSPAHSLHTRELNSADKEASQKALSKAETKWNDYRKTHTELATSDATAAFNLESAVIKGDPAKIQQIAENYKDNVQKLKALADLAQQQLQELNAQVNIDVSDKTKATILVHRPLLEGEEGTALKVSGRQDEDSPSSAKAQLSGLTTLFKICGGETFEIYGNVIKQSPAQFMGELSRQVSDDINQPN